MESEAQLSYLNTRKLCRILNINSLQKYTPKIEKKARLSQKRRKGDRQIFIFWIRKWFTHGISDMFITRNNIHCQLLLLCRKGNLNTSFFVFFLFRSSDSRYSNCIFRRASRKFCKCYASCIPASLLSLQVVSANTYHGRYGFREKQQFSRI